MTEAPKRESVRIGVALIAITAIALSLWHFWTVLVSAPPSTFDDSYMFIRYAKHILAGDGHAWNPGGEQTYGITSLLYVFLITVLRWATSFTDAELVRLASASCAVAAVVVMVISAARFSISSALRQSYLLWAGLLVPTVLISAPYLYHALTGMDTMLAVLMHSVLIFVTLRLVNRGTARALWPVVLVGYLAFLTRPDSALYAAFFPAAAILLLTDAKHRVRLLITFWIALGLVLVLDAGIKYLIFGVPVPLPTYAKMHGHYTEYAGLWMWNPVEYILEFAATVLPFICIAIAFTKRRSLPLLAVFLIPALLTLSTYFNIVQIMGYRARFNMPSLPFFVIGGALMLDRFLDNLPETPKLAGTSVISRLTVILALLVFTPIARAKFPPLYKAKLIEQAPKSAPVHNPGNLPMLSYWQSVDGMIRISQAAPAGSLFAMSEYGCVGAAAPNLSIYDPLGLHDPQTAREGFSSEVLFERDPDLIWMPHPDYIAMRREIMSADEFWDHYDFYPAAFRFGVAVRKTGERSQAVGEAFAKVWKRFYPNAPMSKNQLKR